MVNRLYFALIALFCTLTAHKVHSPTHPFNHKPKGICWHALHCKAHRKQFQGSGKDISACGQLGMGLQPSIFAQSARWSALMTSEVVGCTHLLV